MAKRAGAYRSEKRKKEIGRQKKQEEKRLRRLRKSQGGPGEENIEGEEGETEEQGDVEPGAEAGAEETAGGEGQ